MELTINTIQKAFIADGTDITKMPDVSHLENESDKQAIISNYMLDVVIRSLNNEGQSEKWVADYSDDSVAKYENVYYNSPSSGWSLDGVYDWFSLTHCGSRRALRTRAIGRHLWENFSDLIKETL
jgi:hypothetical protein